jgi:Na+/H+ antiporter NhaD/arsenite permease-like protein
MTPSQSLNLTVIVLTYLGIAFGRIPKLGMNRTTIALVGAALLLALQAINEKQALAAIDLQTIILLLSMMVINANLRLAGFFDLVGGRVLRLARSPRRLLMLVIFASGILSALFLNDPVCLLFTPLVVDVTQRLNRNPIPYLIGLATAANIGSTATITGNPQNLIIGQASGIPYLTFLLALAPVALIGMGMAWAVIVLAFRKEFRGTFEVVSLPEPKIYPPLLWRTIGVVVGLLVAFLLGVPIASSAFIAAGALMVSRLKPSKLLDIEWELLAFFIGLFIVTGAIEASGISEYLFELVAPVLRDSVASLSLITAGLSNIVSNVPAVLLFRPLVPTFPDPQQAWLTLAMSSTLAGNLTLLGSVANLIVAEVALGKGVKLGFWAYLRVGVPLTILTLLFGIVWLTITR